MADLKMFRLIIKDLLLEMAANLPLQLQREKGDPVMRPGLVVDWNDRLILLQWISSAGIKSAVLYPT